MKRITILHTMAFVTTVIAMLIGYTVEGTPAQLLPPRPGPPQLAEKPTPASDTIHFDYNKADISASSSEALDRAGKILKGDSTTILLIVGHTDSSEKATLDLSEKRARSVKKYFQEKFHISDEQLMVESFGSTKPVADNKTKEGRSKNRRVEFRVITLIPAIPPPYVGGQERNERQATFFWNVWAEEGTDVQYIPLTQLDPKPLNTESEYSIYVHLCNCSYENESKGFVSRTAKEKLMKIINEQPLTTKKLTLKVILIPDPDYFQPLSKSYDDLEIDLDKIREQLKFGFKLEGDPVGILRENKPLLPPFVFGGTRFTGIKTRGRKGTGYIGLAIWHNGRPVDDFSVPFCISSSTCPGDTRQYSSQQKESPPINLSAFPDAALHFFGLGSDKVIGVFWNEKEPDKFTIWDTGRTRDGFYDQLGNNIIPKLNQSDTPEKWISNGSALFSLLFPNKTKGGADSGLEFKEYIKEHITKPPFDKDKPPLLFVRFTENKADLPFIIPIGLAAVDIGDGKKTFLGFHFKIETPLANDTDMVKPECIKRWVVSLPTKDQEQKLQKAYQHIDKAVLTSWKAYAKKEFFDTIRRPAQEDEFNSFGAWIEKDQKDNGSAIITAMSHHGKGALSDSSGEVLALNVRREFTQPSVAILNGCGTMEPGATDFIKELNERGVTTVIATSTSVESPMAGDFLSCLGQEIEKAREAEEKEITVSDAFVRTLKCLYKNPVGYDMQVLKYSLLGDGNLRLCIPGVQ
jgi:outer membrane protein OmpA-like peptidoglycan-associated protein